MDKNFFPLNHHSYDYGRPRSVDTENVISICFPRIAVQNYQIIERIAFVRTRK